MKLSEDWLERQFAKAKEDLEKLPKWQLEALREEVAKGDVDEDLG